MYSLIQNPFTGDGNALIERVLGEPESRTFEVKRAKNVGSAIEAIAAFANTDGGTIAIGVEDPSKASGRDRLFGLDESPEFLSELQRKIGERITRTAQLDLSLDLVGCLLRDGSDGRIGLLRVAPSESVHDVRDKGTPGRSDASVYWMSSDDVVLLAYQRGTKSAVDDLVDIPFELLESQEWHSYSQKRQLSRPIDQSLFHLGLAARTSGSDELKPTRAAVLLFAEFPSGLLSAKHAVRLFHYRGNAVGTDPNTNLLRPPETFDGPIRTIIRDAKNALLRGLSTGVRTGPHGFEIVSRYPVRVLEEAIVNAVLHRDYRVLADVVIRVFDDRIEVESPGVFPGRVNASTVRVSGTHPRNPKLVQHLREFPNPPNLDAGEGVPMMFRTMEEVNLYPPIYRGRIPNREAVQVTLLNEERPSIWEQASEYLDTNGRITNQILRDIMRTDDTLRASKQLAAWVASGLIEVGNPTEAKKLRWYQKPESDGPNGLPFVI